MLDTISKRDTNYPMNIEFECGNLEALLEEKRKIFVQDKGSKI